MDEHMTQTTPYGREERLKKPRVKNPHITLASRSKEEWIKINDGGRCFYCKIIMTRERNKIHSRSTDHVHPQSKGGVKTVPCCKRCNQMKGDMSVRRFMSLVAKHGFQGSTLWMACSNYFSRRDKIKNKLKGFVRAKGKTYDDIHL